MKFSLHMSLKVSSLDDTVMPCLTCAFNDWHGKTWLGCKRAVQDWRSQKDCFIFKQKYQLYGESPFRALHSTCPATSAPVKAAPQ